MIHQAVRQVVISSDLIRWLSKQNCGQIKKLTMLTDWKFSKRHQCTCKVIEERTLWGQTVYYVWLANTSEVVSVPKSDLEELISDQNALKESYRIAYVSVAAKIAGVIEQTKLNTNDKLLLAPVESNIIPLPHQISALSRIVSGDRIRYLLADEVGLGKTIEAGLAIRELKLRGLVIRTLVVAPKSLAMQWVAEMDTHFNETFTLVNPSDLEILEQLDHQNKSGIGGLYHDIEYNPWMQLPQVVVTMDAVKPVVKHKKWNKEEINEYNRHRFEKLVQGQWDLVIVDEAHRMGGSTDQVARYLLGKELSKATPYLLLLSATPHQGKSDSFHRLMSLLDPMAFPDADSVNRNRISEFVIRTEKRNTISADGSRLFQPRVTKTLEVDLAGYPRQMELYEAVTEYVKQGYNRALKKRLPHVGFLMVLLQRIVSSSTRAIRDTLEKRLQVLEDLTNSRKQYSEYELEDISDLDAQMQLDLFLEVDEFGRVSEVKEVKKLLDLAQHAENSCPDAKTEALMKLIFQLQGEENDDQLKLIVFTEFVATQHMLQEFLEERGISCSILNGSMNIGERRNTQQRFCNNSRVLISTDAGGEGLNLQFCHVVINYDLPWNPMRIEQRIGRVDRIGQKKTVRAINFVYENSVEARVREVLQSKLTIINEELGIDKTQDVLNTSVSGDTIEKMMTQVLMGDADPDEKVEIALSNIQNEIKEERENCAVYTISEELDSILTKSIQSHPLPYWIERMTINYLRMKNCQVERDSLGWNFSWEDGQVVNNAVFQSSEKTIETNMLTLENPKLRDLVMNFNLVEVQSSLPSVQFKGLPDTIFGYWGLFEIQLSIGQLKSTHMRVPALRREFVPVFLSQDDNFYLQTANHIWDRLLVDEVNVSNVTKMSEATEIRIKLTAEAERSGKDIFDNMRVTHLESLERERERGSTAFSSRRKDINRIGLPEVQQFRIKSLEQEEKLWMNDLNVAQEILPELNLLLMLKIEAGETNE